MTMINGIYAATLSILDKNLGLDIKKTIAHAEKVIDKGCHGVVFFGSTGQSQLISLSEKISLINNLPSSNYKENFIIGTGLNSLSDTISLMKISMSLGFSKFLIMPPAYYKYEDQDVFNFYSNIIKVIPEAKIILYNFEKLSGYKFSENIVYKLVENFPNQIINQIAIVAHTDFELKKPVMPCGACRQVMAEYERIQEENMQVILKAEAGEILVFDSVANLLPLAFQSQTLIKK